MTRTR